MMLEFKSPHFTCGGPLFAFEPVLATNFDQILPIFEQYFRVPNFGSGFGPTQPYWQCHRSNLLQIQCGQLSISRNSKHYQDNNFNSYIFTKQVFGSLLYKVQQTYNKLGSIGSTYVLTDQVTIYPLWQNTQKSLILYIYPYKQYILLQKYTFFFTLNYRSN